MSIRKHITTLKKTPVQVWAQLDDIFGDPNIVLAEAFNDLYNVDWKNLGRDYLTVLTNTLLEEDLTLEDSGHKHYLEHPTEIAKIKRMLSYEEGAEFIWRKYR